MSGKEMKLCRVRRLQDRRPVVFEDFEHRELTIGYVKQDIHVRPGFILCIRIGILSFDCDAAAYDGSGGTGSDQESQTALGIDALGLETGELLD
jgi:hypothetical protein